MLSYVEHYRPSYFLLENVIGLLAFPLKGRMVGRTFAKHEGIRMGVCKFIIRTLTCLGYVLILLNEEVSISLPQVSSAFQSPSSGAIWGTTESQASFVLGCKARSSPSQIPSTHPRISSTTSKLIAYTDSSVSKHLFLQLLVHLATGDTLPPASRSRDHSCPHQCAPFHAVTINDATGDLVG